jgi:hypothetical protein
MSFFLPILFSPQLPNRPRIRNLHYLTALACPIVWRGLLPGEQVTVMGLSPEDARTMRDLQQRLFKYKAAGGDGDGSFTLRLAELCLDKELPEGDVPLTLFLKTENHEDYIVFIKTELHDMFSDTGSDIEKLPFCEDLAIEDV